MLRSTLACQRKLYFTSPSTLFRFFYSSGVIQLGDYYDIVVVCVFVVSICLLVCLFWLLALSLGQAFGENSPFEFKRATETFGYIATLIQLPSELELVLSDKNKRVRL